MIGCGTSLYMAQAWAALREGPGHGRTDAFAASELPAGPRYDVVVALSRSGTTTEVAHALGRTSGARTVAITAVAGTPVADAADDVVVLDFADEQSVVQTRFATTALDAAARARGRRRRAVGEPTPSARSSCRCRSSPAPPTAGRSSAAAGRSGSRTRPR